MIDAALFTMRQLTMLAGSMRKNVWNTCSTSVRSNIKQYVHRLNQTHTRAYVLMLQDLLYAREREAEDSLGRQARIGRNRVLLAERAAAALALQPRLDAVDVVEVLARQNLAATTSEHSTSSISCRPGCNSDAWSPHLDVDAGHELIEADRTYFLVVVTVASDCIDAVHRMCVRVIVVAAEVVQRDVVDHMLLLQQLVKQKLLQVWSVHDHWELPGRFRAPSLADEAEDRRRDQAQAAGEA